MTYNIRLDVASDGLNSWSHRKDFFIEEVNAQHPDILGIQEALPNQVADLVTAFPKMQKSGIGREENGTGEASCIFFNLTKYKLVQEGTFWLSETPDKVSRGWDAACNRVCSFVKLTDKQSHKSFWVFNTHLDHVGEVARTQGIQLILSKISELNAAHLPVVLMGDFNTTPDHSRIKNLKTHFKDTFDCSEAIKSGPSATFNGFSSNKKATERIDYIFVAPQTSIVKQFAILETSRNGFYPSDHFPVIATLYF